MEWVACAERMPEMAACEHGETSDEVLTYDRTHGCMDVRRLERPMHRVLIGRTVTDTWGAAGWSPVDRGDVDDGRITHWMPLPAPPA